MCDDIQLFADNTFLFTNDSDIDAVKEKASKLFEKKFRWCVANQLSINTEKTNFVLFRTKNSLFMKTVCISLTFLTTDGIKCVQILY